MIILKLRNNFLVMQNKFRKANFAPKKSHVVTRLKCGGGNHLSFITYELKIFLKGLKVSMQKFASNLFDNLASGRVDLIVRLIKTFKEDT